MSPDTKKNFCFKNAISLKPPWQATYTFQELGSRQLFEHWFGISSNSNPKAKHFTTRWYSNQGEH